jgi:hypothetical protein
VVGSTCPSGCVPATTVPGPITSSPSADSGYGAPSTFKTEEGAGSSGASDQGVQGSSLRFQPSSDLNRNPNSTEAPRLINPYNRTAAKPIHYATYRPIAEAASAGNTASSSALDVGGWRPSRD